MKNEIPWPRLLAEGSAIVVSILLAFAIDAWWEERQKAAQQHSQLASLASEFREAQRHFDRQVIALDRSMQGTGMVLSLVGPNASEQDGAQFSAAVAQSFNLGVTMPQQGVISDVLASRGDVALGGENLWPGLQEWLAMVGEIAIDLQHLERNREDDFIEALVRSGVSLSAVLNSNAATLQDGSSHPIPASKFSGDLSVLLRDPAIETVFTMRAIRTYLLIALHNEASQKAGELVEQIENVLSEHSQS